MKTFRKYMNILELLKLAYVSLVFCGQSADLARDP